MSLIDNDRGAYDGVYDSPYGEVKLMSRDLVLVGDYADKGVIAGVWTGNRFEGLFTNDDRVGWFAWRFFSKTGDFRDGSWGWLDQDNENDWPLESQAGETPTLDNMQDDVPEGVLQ